jgi:putative transposase
MIRTKRTRAQWQRLIEEQPTSGLTIKDFCKQHKIAVSGFYNWQKKLTNNDNGVNDWLSCSTSRPVEQKQPHWQMELELPGGLVLRLNQLN